jgi:hypothetical protein
VDWLLLRDAVGTLVKSILTIRRHGLIHRIPSPGSFLTQINKCCMGMSSSRRKKDSRKERKRVLREMKKIAEVGRRHGRRYCDLLRGNWKAETDLEELGAQEIIDRMENVLGKLPAAVKQAHERIIGGRKTENKDKELSLYDDSVCVVTGGKESSEVEFGNVLYLSEQADGLVVDFKLYGDAAPGDVKHLDESLDRFSVRGLEIKELAGDRGFDGPTTRERDLAWAVFSHNLWALARLPEAEEDGLLKTG